MARRSPNKVCPVCKCRRAVPDRIMIGDEHGPVIPIWRCMKCGARSFGGHIVSGGPNHIKTTDEEARIGLIAAIQAHIKGCESEARAALQEVKICNQILASMGNHP